MNESELEEVIGPVAMREYHGAPDWDQEKILTWAASLRSMPDGEFVLECSSKILDSAMVNSFKGNWDGTHCRASACHYEARRRFQAAGHAKDCGGHNLYSEGFNRAMRSQGHRTSEPYPCTCKKEKG